MPSQNLKKLTTEKISQNTIKIKKDMMAQEEEEERAIQRISARDMLLHELEAVILNFPRIHPPSQIECEVLDLLVCKYQFFSHDLEIVARVNRLKELRAKTLLIGLNPQIEPINEKVKRWTPQYVSILDWLTKQRIYRDLILAEQKRREELRRLFETTNKRQRLFVRMLIERDQRKHFTSPVLLLSTQSPEEEEEEVKEIKKSVIIRNEQQNENNKITTSV